MTQSLRRRIIVTILPLLALPAALGGVAVVLLYQLGGRIDAILRENYDSVLYMQRLDEALERIDSSFQSALASREPKARDQYALNWAAYREWLSREQQNITEPGEAELVERLTALTKQYRDQGDAFYRREAAGLQRQQSYFGGKGLLATFKQIKDTSGLISALNQESMVRASHDARAIARRSVLGLTMGLVATAVLALFLAWHTLRSILRPIQAVTDSAVAIGLGDLDQVVPVLSADELGRLAEAFNAMARHLRHYRRTDYARLLRAQRTSQATIDSFPHAVLVVDEEGHVELANPLAQRLFGVVPPRDGQTGHPWQPPEALRQPLQDALRGQHPFLPEGFDRVINLPVSGHERSFLPRALPIADPYGNTLGAAVLLEDVTRYRLLDRVKSDLVATASHELKTPLTSVRLALHLLLEEAVGPLTSKQIELLVDARDNAERLLAMVNHLLDLARLEQGQERLELRLESPAGLLAVAADGIRPRAEDKGVAVAIHASADLPTVPADAGRLGHALANLLDNALASTDRGGQITLTASADADGVTLEVADTGHGIPAEHLPYVFERFFRIPGRGREGGTGLGLAIVWEIVAAHAGTVSCESRLGEGTTFRIHVPARQDLLSSRETSGSATAPGAEGSGR